MSAGGARGARAAQAGLKGLSWALLTSARWCGAVWLPVYAPTAAVGGGGGGGVGGGEGGRRRWWRWAGLVLWIGLVQGRWRRWVLTAGNGALRRVQCFLWVPLACMGDTTYCYGACRDLRTPRAYEAPRGLDAQSTMSSDDSSPRASGMKVRLPAALPGKLNSLTGQVDVGLEKEGGHTLHPLPCRCWGISADSGT